MTSNGVNGVMISPGKRINLFQTNDATTQALIVKYLKFRNTHKKQLFDIVVSQMLEAAPAHSKYLQVAQMLEEIGKSGHFDETIGICSFCQTWASSVSIGQPQFSVPSPHFQNRIYVRDASNIQNIEQIKAYLYIIDEHDKTLEKMGTAGAIKTFINLDQLIQNL